MIQDIAPKVLHNQYVYKEPKETDYIAVFSENYILLKQCGKSLEFPMLKDFQDVPVCEYLFAVDEDCYFLAMDFEIGRENMPLCSNHKSGYNETGYEETRYEELEDNKSEYNETGYNETGYKEAGFMKISDVRFHADRETSFAAYTAYHLYQWYKGSRFCGSCGGRMKPDRKERMMYCTQCGRQVYPRISPAVIVAVTDGDRILLSKYANREYKRYALIAGFVEAGETAEEAVQREVMEEVGLRVKNIRYYKSQPWGIDANLLLGYFAQLDGSDTIHLDRSELAVAEWADRAALADMDDGFSLTREMMQVFSAGLAFDPKL